ncbi:MAG: VOC family protein [Actinomycetota bacterium]|nr:VOC family protein [Actinomycetota bacterium]
MPNRVVHFEIPADDVSRAQDFYRQTFGWDINEMQGAGYTLLGTAPSDEGGTPAEPGAINGGMLKRQGPITNPVITVEVPDIDEALETIERCGGQVALGKFSVGDIGFSAYFIDSEGNTLGLWQPRA